MSVEQCVLCAVLLELLKEASPSPCFCTSAPCRDGMCEKASAKLFFVELADGKSCF